MSARARPPRTQQVGVLHRRGRFMVAEPLFDRGRPLAVQRDGRAHEGELALLKTGGQGRGRAQLVRTLGRPDVARDVIEALMLDRGLAREFPGAVEEAAEARPREHERHDLRSLTTFTIDPVSARDFDDAISAEEREPGLWRIWVHIADVAAHVGPGSPVDREAFRRGTSVYVPGAVEPMLPEALSNRACSLVPAEDRPAVTVEMDLRGDQVERVEFRRSLIRSDERLDYDRVDRIFAGDDPALGPWATPLAAARAAAGALADARARRGTLAVETSEPEFEFDEVGNVTSVRPSVQTESHRVIEHLMIAANEQVATLLAARKIPTLYRVHEQPEPARVERLIAQLASLDVPTPALPQNMSPRQAGEVAGEASRLVAEHVRRHGGRGRAALTSLVLRALQQARYSPQNLGHAGLQSHSYSHFTSPIRRYPDLVAHRALLSAVGGDESEPAASDLEEQAAWSSERERDAMAIERAADDIARSFLLERELYEGGWEQDFEGEVVGMIPAGLFVAFGDGHEGFLPVRRLRGEWWGANEEGTIMTGTRSGKAVRLGDPVRVEVERIDAPRGRVDLLPVEV